MIEQNFVNIFIKSKIKLKNKILKININNNSFFIIIKTKS